MDDLFGIGVRIVKKEFRIKDNDEFQQIFKSGNSFANRQLVIYFINESDQSEQTHFRIGLSVGKKIGNAVTRNRIKRYLRQSFQDLEDKLLPTLNIIIIARQPTKDMGYLEIKKSLVHLLSRQHLLIKK